MVDNLGQNGYAEHWPSTGWITIRPAELDRDDDIRLTIRLEAARAMPQLTRERTTCL
jgi:hypothetical protein